MNKPLVSVINATYNQSNYVKQLLESLAEQTYQNLEIIIVSDGSTDKTEKIVQNFAAKYRDREFKVKFIEKPHTGVQETRNKGLDEAMGTYIIFPDSDCVLHFDCIEKMVNVLEDRPNIAYVYANMENVGFYNSILRCGIFDEARLRKGNYIPVVTLMRREGCPRWDLHIKRHQDYCLWLRWLNQGGYGQWIDEVLFRHYTRKDSLTFNSVSIKEANESVWRTVGIIK